MGIKGIPKWKLKYTSHFQKWVKHDQQIRLMTIVRLCIKRMAICFVPNGQFQQVLEEQPSESVMRLGRSSVFMTSHLLSRAKFQGSWCGCELRHLTVTTWPFGMPPYLCGAALLLWVAWRDDIRFISLINYLVSFQTKKISLCGVARTWLIFR